MATGTMARAVSLKLNMSDMSNTDLDLFQLPMEGGFGQSTSTDAAMADFFAPTTHFVQGPSPVSTTRTVSPKDLLADVMSAPPSAALTNLTSPDLDFGNSGSYDTSPLFDSVADISAADNWFPLFPADNEPSSTNSSFSQPIERTSSSYSQAQASPTSETNSPLILNATNRRKSSTSSPAINASVGKSRRRKGPLPPIAVDPNDRVALKRARNTLAARESRQRKFAAMEELQARVDELEKLNDELAAQAEKWKSLALAAVGEGSLQMDPQM